MGDVIQNVRTIFTADSSALRSELGRITSTLSRLQSLALGLAGSYGLGRVIKGLVEVNAQSETTAIGIATMVQAADRMNGRMTPFTTALGIAKSTLEDLRQVAVDTPATFDQVAESFRAIVFPARTAGMSMKAIAQLAGDVATLESAEGSPGLISRDIAQLLRGTNNVDSQFLRPFKDELLKLVKQGNQAGAIKRIGEIIQLDPEARRAFGDSFEGKVSTFQDQIQAIQRAAGAPLFEVANEYLAKMSKWLTENKDEVKRIAKEVGEGLVKAFLAVKNVVQWLIESGVGEMAVKIMLGVKAVGLLGGAFNALIPILGGLAASPLWAIIATSVAAFAALATLWPAVASAAEKDRAVIEGAKKGTGGMVAGAIAGQIQGRGVLGLSDAIFDATAIAVDPNRELRGALTRESERFNREQMAKVTVANMSNDIAKAESQSLDAAFANGAMSRASWEDLAPSISKKMPVNIDARGAKITVNTKLETDDPARFADASIKSAFLGASAKPLAAVTSIGGVSSGGR